MEKMFDQKFDDGTRLYCCIQNGNFALGHCGIGKASEVFNEIKGDNDLIQYYIHNNNLCPNDSCVYGYVDVGWGYHVSCQCCNFF